MFEQSEGLVVPSFQTFLLIETFPCSSVQPCLLQECSSKPCSFSVASKSKNYLIYTSQLSSIFTVRYLDLLISFIFLQADIPLPQSHLECEFYKVRSWISAMSSVFKRYCPLYSRSAVSSSFQCQTVLCRIFFLLFFKQQELIFLPGFAFPASCRSQWGDALCLSLSQYTKFLRFHLWK